ncbi:hypothetical protein GCM10009746_03050 [Microbacterium paludicola]
MSHGLRANPVIERAKRVDDDSPAQPRGLRAGRLAGNSAHARREPASSVIERAKRDEMTGPRSRTGSTGRVAGNALSVTG